MSEDLDEDLDEGSGGGGGGGGGDGGKRKKLIIMIVLPILLLVAAALGAHFTGLDKSLFGGDADKHDKAPEVGSAPAEGTATVFYDLPEMLVNLSSSKAKKAFLKIRVSLELGGPADVARVEAVIPRIVDNFQVYLRELRLEDLQGASGMYRLREELLTRVVAAAKPARVNDVLFKEMLIQ